MADSFPWLKFYTSDWLGNGNLRRSSLAARGMWMDMLCMMHESEERGVLISQGKPWTDQQIAAATGGDLAASLSVLRELLENRVAKRDSRGAIYSSRMLRDERKRSKCSLAGRNGGGNPSLTFKGQSKGQSKGGPKRQPKGASGLLVSDSLSSLEERVQREKPPPCPIPSVNDLVSDELLALASEWKGRVLGPHEMCEVADRVDRYGEPLLTKAFRLHLKTGTALGNWKYLDKIIEGGAQDRAEPGVLGLGWSKVFETKP